MPWTCPYDGEINEDTENECHLCGRARGAMMARREQAAREEEAERRQAEELGRILEMARGGGGAPETQAARQAYEAKERERDRRRARGYLPFRRRFTYGVRRAARRAGRRAVEGEVGEGEGFDVGLVIELIIGLLISIFAWYLTGPALGQVGSALILAGGVLLSLRVILHPEGQLGVLRAACHILGFIALALATLFLNIFVTLVMLFLGYFTLPSRARGREPGDILMPYLRLALGIFIPAVLFIVLSGGWNFTGFNAMAAAMAFISAGIMISLPRPEEAVIVTRRGREGVWSTALVLVGWFFGVYHLFILEGIIVTGILFSVVAGLIVLIAKTVRAEDRALVGAPMIIILLGVLFIGSGQIQQAAGQAAFGDYWPSVQVAVEPIANMFKSLSAPAGTLGFGFECLVNPIACQQRFKPIERTQGTIKAIEITNMQVIGENTVSRIFQRMDVLLDIRNEGEEESGLVFVEFANATLGTAKKPPKVGGVTVKCPQKDFVTQYAKDVYAFAQASKTPGTWCLIEKLFPGENTQITAVYQLDLTKAGKVEPRGNFVNYQANVSYIFNVSSSLDVQLMRNDTYDELARNNRLKFTDVPTTDTGGPVRLGLAISNNRMPIRAGLEAAPVLFELNNQGSGDVVEVSYASVNVSGILPGDVRLPPPTEGACSTENGELKFEVTSANPISSPQTTSDPAKTTRRSTCVIPLRHITTETYTTAFIGQASYTYTITRTVRSQVEFGTGKLCVCDGGTPANVTLYPEACSEDCPRYCASELNEDSETGGRCVDEP